MRTEQQQQRRNQLEKKAEELMQYVTRGIESYSLWHHLDPERVTIERIHFAVDGAIVVTYGRV